MLAPLDTSQWSPVRAAHLLNRAGFGGSPRDIERVHAMGPGDAVDYLVDYEKTLDPANPPAFAADGPPAPAFEPRDMRRADEAERKQRLQEKRRDDFRHMVELRGWWLERMRDTPRPLQEKLTLFWHGHFATGFRKVRSPYAMYLQNETFRRHANGSWEALITAMNRDPAMLRYLDGVQNRRSAPNENYARELMELFTLGEGNYTEDDIREAARALTGWTLNRRERRVSFRAMQHDGGSKTFMGETGRFRDDDIVRIILKNPAAAPFIVARLWSFFAYEDPEAAIVAGLADTFRTGGFQWKPVLKQMFRSRAFYSSRAGRTQIKGPVQWLVSTSRYLEAPLPPRPLALYMTSSLGQELFEPPNVKGWEGGAAWITADSLLQRYNFAAAIVEGGDDVVEQMGNRFRRAARELLDDDAMMDRMEDGAGPGRGFLRDRLETWLSTPVADPDVLLPAGRRSSRDAAQQHLHWRLFQSNLRPQDREIFKHYFAALPPPDQWTDADVRKAVHAMMSTPQFQLT